VLRIVRYLRRRGNMSSLYKFLKEY
jgi:hypothetical protein